MLRIVGRSAEMGSVPLGKRAKFVSKIVEWQPATEFVDREKRRVVRRWIVWPSAETGVVRVGNPRGDVLRIVGLNVGTDCVMVPKERKRVLWIAEICVGT